jgi:hypothetical protein
MALNRTRKQVMNRILEIKKASSRCLWVVGQGCKGRKPKHLTAMFPKRETRTLESTPD